MKAANIQGTGEGNLTEVLPLPDCIRHLKAMRLPLATTLAKQLESYERDPDRMLKMRILRNVEQLEGR